MYTTKNIDIRSKSLYVVHVKFIDIQVTIFFNPNHKIFNPYRIYRLYTPTVQVCIHEIFIIYIETSNFPSLIEPNTSCLHSTRSLNEPKVKIQVQFFQ